MELAPPPPDYSKFQAYLASHKQQLKQIAVQVENRFAAALAEPPGTSRSSVRRVKLTRDEANAWLSMSLRQFIEDRGFSFPRKIRQVMVSAEGQHVALHFNLETLEFSQVISIVLDVQFARRGEAELSLIRVRGGSLPLPLGSLIAIMKKNAASLDIKHSIDSAARLLRGEKFDTTLTHDDERNITVVALGVDDDAVTVEFVVEQKEGDEGSGAREGT